MKSKIVLSILSLIYTFSVSANAENSFSNEEIYSQMCSKCHGKNAEGNPLKKGPALNDLTAHELEISMFDLKSGGLNQSSGTQHEIMEHNMKKIIEKGMDYDTKSMSEYIFYSFNPEAKFYNKTTDKKLTVSEIFGKMCSKCHGRNAQGNPKKKGPALNDMTAHEIEQELIDIQKGDLSQSSGSDHEIMEHNQEKIEEKGMSYNPKDMAKYIEENFYKE